MTSRFYEQLFLINSAPSFTSTAFLAISERFFQNETFMTTIGMQKIRLSFIIGRKIQFYFWCIFPFYFISFVHSYNEPQKLEWKNATKEEVLPSKYELKQNALVSFLMNMKTGTKVFQHFLMKTNLSHLVDGEIRHDDVHVGIQNVVNLFIFRFFVKQIKRTQS